jgi:energy-converting hydrogenase Eha subunit C
MTDDRPQTDPRPRYGEIATIEEQRRAAGLPPLDEVIAEPPTAEPGRSANAVSPRGSSVDRVVTIALLAYGLFSVVSAGLSYLDLAGVMNEAMKVMGIQGEFTNYAAAKTWGTVAAIVLALGWVVTAVLATRRLRRGALAWWVPVVGAAVSSLAVAACIAVPMMGDPAFLEQLRAASGS